MAKRTRGSNRPGQRHSAPSRQQPRAASRPAQGLSASEEARAAELEAQIVARERDAQAALSRARTGPREADLGRGGRSRGQSPLAVRAAEEYGYVSRDVLRILRVGGSMIGLLAVFFILIDVLHVITV
jgi:hypothetical protein